MLGLWRPGLVRPLLRMRGAAPMRLMSHETASAAETPQPEAERVPTLEELEGTRAPKNSVVGVVVGTAMQKTIMVKVSKIQLLLPMGIRRKHTKKYMAHDEEEVCVVGDVVRIRSCRPLSKRKSHILHEIIRKNPQLDPELLKELGTPQPK